MPGFQTQNHISDPAVDRIGGGSLLAHSMLYVLDAIPTNCLQQIRAGLSNNSKVLAATCWHSPSRKKKNKKEINECNSSRSHVVVLVQLSNLNDAGFELFVLLSSTGFCVSLGVQVCEKTLDNE